MASDTDALQYKLPDRRLRFGVFHHWRANRFAFFHELELTMLRETGSGRNQVTHDHVFLEAAQPVDFTQRSRFSEHTCRVLERSRRNKAVGFQRSLGDPEQHRNSLRRLAACLHDFLVLSVEVEFIDLIAPEQCGIAGIGDLHFAQHLAHDDLDVLIVNLYALETIDLLHFVHQVLLQLLRAAHFQNLVRHNGAFGQLLTLFHEIAFEDDDVLGEGNEMLFFSARVRIFQNQAAFAAYCSAQLDDAINLGNLSRILWPTSFEQFRNAPQTTRDVFCLCDFAWGFCQQRACPYLLTLLDDDVSASRN